MSVKKPSPLIEAAKKTITYLREQGVLSDEHALTVSLIEALCDEWAEAVTTTQRANVSKELRYCLALLPEPAPETDDVADLLAELADDDG